MNIIDGDTIEIREERHFARGTVFGIERGTMSDGTEVDFVLADFGGVALGRIPLIDGALPKTCHLIKTT